MRGGGEGTIRLRDGRCLGYAEWGDPGGWPLLYCHGWPSSRVEGRLAERAGRAAGARVIAPDRPGMGLSSFQAGRRLVDWPDDAGQLADALGLERFAVLGISGGSPYAAACAWGLPGRVTSAGIVSGLGPPDAPGATAGMSRENRLLLRAGRLPLLPGALMAVVAAVARRRPELVLERASVAAVDRAAWWQLREVFRASLVEAFRGGGRGPARELRLSARPWGLRLQDIRAPVRLWHGELDPNASVAMARQLAAAIPGCRATFYPWEGHLHFAHRLPEILAALGPS